MVCLGLEPGVAGCKAQANPMSYIPRTYFSIFISEKLPTNKNHLNPVSKKNLPNPQAPKVTTKKPIIKFLLGVLILESLFGTLFFVLYFIFSKVSA